MNNSFKAGSPRTSRLSRSFRVRMYIGLSDMREQNARRRTVGSGNERISTEAQALDIIRRSRQERRRQPYERCYPTRECSGGSSVLLRSLCAGRIRSRHFPSARDGTRRICIRGWSHRAYRRTRTNIRRLPQTKQPRRWCESSSPQ